MESIIEQHAELLAKRGCEVALVAGREASGDLPVHVIPQIDAARPESVELEAELAAGRVSERFERTMLEVESALEPLAATADVIIAHNAFTLHFSLPLTAALWRLSARRPAGSVIAWCHDLSWINPLYLPLMHQGFPWDLLRTRAPHVRYVAVSEERKRELEDLWGSPGPDIVVVPNGVDAARFLRLSAETREIVRRFALFDQDIVLLLPVRITRRKNIEAGIRAVRALRDRGLAARYLITGPVAPHHPVRSLTYLDELTQLRDALGLRDDVIFLSREMGHRLEDVTVAELYAVSDVLLFPSEQEGFGLPVLEAGLARLPAVVSAIPVFREVGGGDVQAFELDASPDKIAEAVLQAVGSAPPRLYRRVLRDYRWDAIVDQRLLPLLHTAGQGSHA